MKANLALVEDPRPKQARADVVRLSDRSRTERRIAKGLRNGDPAALDQAYAAYGGTLLAYIVDTLGDRAAAEDVRQQVFLELWQRRNQYDAARAGLFTWIMTIARSRSIDYLRRRIPRPQDPAVTARLAESADSPDAFDEMVERWRIAQLLRRIPQDEAEVLRLRFYKELSQQEIATRLDMPLGTVKTRMTEALRRLREMIEGGEDR